MKLRRLSIVVLSAGCTLLLGKPYEPIKSVPPGMAVVYVYAGDVDSLQTVLIDKDAETADATHSISMLKESYYPYLLGAGMVRVLTVDGEEPECVRFEAIPGLQYWVRIAKEGAETRRIEVVSKDVGLAEIAGHRRISEEAKERAEGSYPVPCPENAAEGSR